MSSRNVLLDFGPRSNDSRFAGFDDSLPVRGIGAARAPIAVVPSGQALAFRVGIVDTEPDLLRVQALRQAAYGHHLPALAAHFGQADPVDRWPDVTIFAAEDKATGRMVGSARIQCNRSQPLQIERSTELPAHFHGRLLAEITRMAVISGYAHPVKLALMKAIHLYCIAMQISGIVAASRPSLMRQYLNIGFGDLYGDERMVPMAHGSGLEHRVLFRDTAAAEAYHRERNHRDDDFVFRTYHPDIQIFDAVSQVPMALRHESAEPNYGRAA